MNGTFSPPPSEAQFKKLEEHFGHTLPSRLKEIFIHYNGGRPKLAYLRDDEDSSISYFYSLDENMDSTGNIWWAINAFYNYLGINTLPFAEDEYGGVFYLKWMGEKTQVWLFQYGDDALDSKKMIMTKIKFPLLLT